MNLFRLHKIRPGCSPTQLWQPRAGTRNMQYVRGEPCHETALTLSNLPFTDWNLWAGIARSITIYFRYIFLEPKNPISPYRLVNWEGGSFVQKKKEHSFEGLVSLRSVSGIWPFFQQCSLFHSFMLCMRVEIIFHSQKSKELFLILFLRLSDKQNNRHGIFWCIKFECWNRGIKYSSQKKKKLGMRWDVKLQNLQRNPEGKLWTWVAWGSSDWLSSILLSIYPFYMGLLLAA